MGRPLEVVEELAINRALIAIDGLRECFARAGETIALQAAKHQELKAACTVLARRVQAQVDACGCREGTCRTCLDNVAALETWKAAV